MTGYLTAALGGALFAAVILAAFLRQECRYSNQAHTAYQQERAARQDVERQLTAATNALLTDLTHITPEDFR